MINIKQGKALLSVQNVTKHFGAQTVLDGVSLTIHENDRIGLIGKNGSGKSTLMRILADLMEPDAGFTTRAQGLRVALLDQHCVLNPEQTVSAALEAATSIQREMLRHWHDLHERLAYIQGGCWEQQEVQQECEELQHRIDVLHAWNLDVEIKRIAEALRLPDLERQLSLLSGGELRRVDLAAKLLEHPDVLLLDEPTNHIDTDSVAWIERFLESYEGACILVTHDRYFLDRATNRIVELDNSAVYSYPGNYERFLEYKANLEAVMLRTEANRQALIKRELAWYRRMPKARGTKAKARIDRLFDAEEKGPPPPDKKFAFAIPEPERLGKDILEARLVTHGYKERILFKHFSLFMQKGMRVGIVGPNGCGKSTLLRLLLGREEPDSGEVLIGQSTHFLYVDQTLADMDSELTVLDFVSDGQRHLDVGKHRIHVPSYLESFLFDKSCVDMPVGRLSGGERRRVDLAKKLLYGGNFLVLDEPTNDLDLYTLRVLEETVESFNGCALIVSHDRYLLNRLCTHMLIFEEDGNIVQIAGNFTDYLLYRERKREDEKRARADTKPVATVTGPKSRTGLTYNEKKELESIESTIHRAELELEDIQQQVNDPGFYAQPHTTTQSVLTALDNAQQRIETLYQRWQFLEEKSGTSSK